MQLIGHDDEGVTIKASWDELAIFNNAINETAHEIEDWEFPTRVGVTRDAAKTLLAQVGAALQLEPRNGQARLPSPNE
jgi:hypothetical protein